MSLLYQRTCTSASRSVLEKYGGLRCSARAHNLYRNFKTEGPERCMAEFDTQIHRILWKLHSDGESCQPKVHQSPAHDHWPRAGEAKKRKKRQTDQGTNIKRSLQCNSWYTWTWWISNELGYFVCGHDLRCPSYGFPQTSRTKTSNSISRATTSKG